MWDNEDEEDEEDEGGGRHNLHSEEDFNAGGRIADPVVLGRFE